jgi:hypothetical protein
MGWHQHSYVTVSILGWRDRAMPLRQRTSDKNFYKKDSDRNAEQKGRSGQEK